MMRSVLLSTAVLHDNLVGLVEHHGPDIVLDLRANAYGCGVEEVAAIARDAGVTRAVYGRGPQSQALAASEPTDQLFESWWSGVAGDVLEFCADVISLKRVPSGAAVSYGYHYTTARETTLALVCVGYADGVPRSASGSGLIALDGALYPIAGRIAMDQCVVDVGDATVEVGQRATLWGSTPTLHQWATWSNRPAKALLSHIGARVVKQWV